MKVYTLQINYKSGISMQSEFKSFSLENGTCSWEIYGDKGPLLLGVDDGVDDIESVWQISVREVEAGKGTA